MSVKCLKCGYEMGTGEEVFATLAHVGSGLLDIFGGGKREIMGPAMNQKVGKSEGVKCPNCGEIGRWKNI